MKGKLRILLLAFMLALTACVGSEQPPTQPLSRERPSSISMIVSVSDGDTLSAVVNGIPEKIRLVGIDCPEHDQPFAKEATQLAKQLALEKALAITEMGRDKWHRLLGRLLNRELVREGACWWYRKYAPGDSMLEELEKVARETKKGLWADPQPVPPWEWRKR